MAYESFFNKKNTIHVFLKSWNWLSVSSFLTVSCWWSRLWIYQNEVGSAIKNELLTLKISRKCLKKHTWCCSCYHFQVPPFSCICNNPVKLVQHLFLKSKTHTKHLPVKTKYFTWSWKTKPIDKYFAIFFLLYWKLDSMNATQPSKINQ